MLESLPQLGCISSNKLCLTFFKNYDTVKHDTQSWVIHCNWGCTFINGLSFWTSVLQHNASLSCSLWLISSKVGSLGGHLQITKFGCQQDMQPLQSLYQNFCMLTLKKYSKKILLQWLWSLLNHNWIFSHSWFVSIVAAKEGFSFKDS